MKLDAIPFCTTDWSEVTPTQHPGDVGMALWRTQKFGDIRVRIVEPEQYLQSIGFLAGNKAFAESPEAYDGAGFDEPMMVMAGFSERKLDLFLTEMRRKKVPPIALKAIVTTQNQAWNSLQLYRELKEEHEKMKSYRK